MGNLNEVIVFLREASRTDLLSFLRAIQINQMSPLGITIVLGFFLVIVWSLAWKGMALWKAAQQKNLKWFIALLFINTLGILEILYIYVFSKKQSLKDTNGQAV